MRLPKRSELWLIVGALFLLAGRRKRRARKYGGGWTPQGTEETPGKIPMVPKKLSFQQLKELAAAAAMQNPEIAAAVALAESGGRTDFKDSTGARGLWRINPLTCPKQWANGEMLLHAGFNAQAAGEMSNNGTDWSSWESFRNGSYQKHLPKQ